MRTALVTGAGGALGSALVEQLRASFDHIVAVARPTGSAQPTADNVEIVEWDLRCTDAAPSLGIGGPLDLVINAAGIYSNPEYPPTA